MALGFEIAARLAQLRHRSRNRLMAGKALPKGGEIEGKRIGGHLVSGSSHLQQFYEAYFSSPEEKCVIQVGANDGIMCDPLRRFLAPSRNQNLRVVLIEPIPFYFNRLQALYADYPNISVRNAACGATTGRAPLYFIEPDVADQMNGDGPRNNWAHGQGSFDRSIIEYWIERNRFRGEDYVRNIGIYYDSIKSLDVDICRLADVELSQAHENLLVVLDVQGFEFDVIRGIDWSHPPAYIVFEDDLDKSGPIDKYLDSKGYTYLCGRTDRVYVSS